MRQNGYSLNIQTDAMILLVINHFIIDLRDAV